MWSHFNNTFFTTLHSVINCGRGKTNATISPTVCFCFFRSLSLSTKVEQLLKYGHMCQTYHKIEVALFFFWDTVRRTFVLTLPSGWAGCYTCPALSPYQFGPMRSPDVTIRSQWSAVKPKSAVKPNKSPAAWDRWRVVWLFLSGGLRLVSSSPSD